MEEKLRPSFVIKVDDVLDKYNEIWNKIKETLSTNIFIEFLFMMKENLMV